MNLLQMSFSGVFIILTILIIRFFALNKLPKKTFVILWSVTLLRLLLPFNLSSPLSVYTLIDKQHNASNTSAVNFVPKTLPYTFSDNLFSNDVHTDSSQEMEQTQAIGGLSIKTVLFIVWLLGVILFALYFIYHYFNCLREFKMSFPLSNAFLNDWQSRHPLRRRLSFPQSGQIPSPLTYGIFHPIILLPKGLDWNNTERLNYILAHEFIHIQRFDGIQKLFLAAAVCVHWFNPMVWIMYFIANRDLELSCDESVIRDLGTNTKTDYARTLLDLEMKKSGLTPLCNHFSKYSIEERIKAIMKFKKTSYIALFVAVFLIITVAAVFTTTAAGRRTALTSISDTSFSEEDYEKLTALYFNNCEAMTIHDFQEKILTITDTSEYHTLLEKFSQDEYILSLKDSNATAAFIHYILIPLTAERWQTRNFQGSFTSAGQNNNKPFTAEAVTDAAMFEYNLTSNIKNRDRLTVGEYDRTRKAFTNGLENFFNSKNIEELKNESSMKSSMDAEIVRLKKKWDTDSLQIDIIFTFLPLQSEVTAPKENDTVTNAVDSTFLEERSRYPNASEEDYLSLLTLQTKDYQKKSISDFNMSLLEWANNHFEASQSIGMDVALNDVQISLTEEDYSFLALTYNASGAENACYVRSNYTGEPEEDPILGRTKLASKNLKDSKRYLFFDLSYFFSYHISDKNKLTIGDRDFALKGFMETINKFWENTSLDDLVTMEKHDIAATLQNAAAQYSTDLILITITEDDIYFEKMIESLEKE